MNTKLKVIIHCAVYNHEPYLRDCLEGFIMQKTNFPFKAVVHDDCSTDASAAIIREYAEKYPDIIEPIYETENIYSKNLQQLRNIMNKACCGRSDYIAYCEGDDYWIDPYKLQKQVDYMDSHPECTMTYTDVYVETPQGRLSRSEQEKLWGKIRCDNKVVDVRYVINQHGATIHTCSLLCKEGFMNDIPEKARKCHVGDVPMEIFASLKGSVYGMSDITAVYRYQSIGSWTQRQATKNIINFITDLNSYVCMLDSLDQYSNKRYTIFFQEAIVNHVVSQLILNRKDVKNEVLSKKFFMKLLLPSFCKTFSPTPSFSPLKKLLLRAKYFPFYPFYSPICKLVKSLSIKQRIKFALLFIFNTLSKKR